MANFVLCVAALVSIVNALITSPNDLFCTSKSAQQAPTCPQSVSPFHLLCGPLHFGNAADACAADGYQLAVLDDYNKFEALWSIRNCTNINVWIDSFNGQRGDGCFQFVNGQIPMAETNLPAGFCQDTQQAVLCQDIPVDVITETSYIATSTISDIKTITREVIPTCPVRPQRPCKPSSTDSEFVILKDHLPYSQAECACRQLRMKLADLTIFNFLDASNELYHELGPRKNGWVHSWNGDHYERDTCLALWTGSSGPNGAIAQPKSCRHRLPVICQKRQKHSCDCKPQERDCHCIQHDEDYPHHQVLMAEGGPGAAQEKKQQVANKQDKQEEVSKQDKQEEANMQNKYQDADEADLVDNERDKCIHGEGPCPRVCKYKARDIRVISGNYTAYQASYACSRFGWTLLDYHSRQFDAVSYLKDKCWAENSGLWIRSFNGVDGGACMLVNGGEGVPVSWLLSADDCLALGGRGVLCQTKEPTTTSLGPWDGTVTYTTTTVDGTTYTSQFTATVTTTITLLEQ